MKLLPIVEFVLIGWLALGSVAALMTHSIPLAMLFVYFAARIIFYGN
jgi:hypothetical protein